MPDFRPARRVCIPPSAGAWRRARRFAHPAGVFCCFQGYIDGISGLISSGEMCNEVGGVGTLKRERSIESSGARSGSVYTRFFGRGGGAHALVPIHVHGNVQGAYE